MIAYTDENVRFAKWCRSSYGIRYIREITPEMAELYITELHDRELSGGYIGKVTLVECWNFVNEAPVGIGNPPDEALSTGSTVLLQKVLTSRLLIF